jgi:hypothetical protein
MSGMTPPNTVSIQDCSKHMAEGGKKDALYIADLFEEKVLEFDPQRIYTDVFYFDGASNVQKAGDVLMARFPQSFCFHGGGACCFTFLFIKKQNEARKGKQFMCAVLQFCDQWTYFYFYYSL